MNDRSMGQIENAPIEGLDPSNLKKIKRNQSITLVVDNWARKVVLDGIVCIEDSMRSCVLVLEKTKAWNNELQNVKREKNNLSMILHEL